MTSSSPPCTSDEDTMIDGPPTRGRHLLDSQAQLREGLRQSIIAKRHARGEKQLNIEYTTPQEMELSSAEIEKKERRREQNRRAAQRCRNKKRMNQKNVIQSYEKLKKRNTELELELETVKQELNILKNTCSIHSKCCPSFAKVKLEYSREIKTEPVTDDELQDASIEDYKFQDFIDQENYGPFSQYMSNNSRTKVFPYGSNQNPSSVEPVLSPPHIWQHSSTNYVQNQSSLNCLINPPKAQIVLMPTSNEHHQQKQPNHQQPQQLHIEHVEHFKPPQEPEISPLYRPISQSQLVIIPPIPNFCTQKDPEHVQVFPLETSPNQVVPSLRSPRPSSAISGINVSCESARPASVNLMSALSGDLHRHRSLSGGSYSGYEPVRSCMDEKRFSSVSSEGSLYVDTPGSMRIMEVPDLDTDDVFISAGGTDGIPTNGHDSNNNLETVPDNNRVTPGDIFQLLLQMPTMTNSADTHRSDSGDHIIQMEDVVSSFIQNEEFPFLSPLEEQQAIDALSQLLSEPNRLDC